MPTTTTSLLIMPFTIVSKAICFPKSLFITQEPKNPMLLTGANICNNLKSYNKFLLNFKYMVFNMQIVRV